MPGLTSGLTSGSSPKSLPASSAGAARAYPPLKYNSYCDAQRAIAEHNSRHDGKVYKAPCDLAPAPPAGVGDTPPARRPPTPTKKPPVIEPTTA